MSSKIEPACAATVIGSWFVIDEAGVIVAICTRRDLAARIAHLWDTHGLADIPDDLQGLE